MFRSLKEWFASSHQIIERQDEAKTAYQLPNDLHIEPRFDLPAKKLEWKPFADLGLIRSEASEWIMPLIKALHARGAGYAEMVREIRNQGEQLSKEEKRILGARANLKLGHKFVEALTEIGRVNPAKAADDLVYENYSIPLISANANELRRDKNFKYLYLIVDNSDEKRVCANALRLSKKRRILRVEAPPLPLNGCKKRCSCWYFVDDQCLAN